MRHYANDESDRKLRNRNYYLGTYVIPFLLAVAISAAFYWAAEHKLLDRNEVISGYLISLVPAMIISSRQQKNWLKMPDGSWHNTRSFPANSKINFYEPDNYLAEYRFSRITKAGQLALGLFIMAISIILVTTIKKNVMPILLCAGFGLLLAYWAFKGLIDKKAKLKIASTGLWTEKLGFVNWDDIRFAEVVEIKGDERKEYNLEIRLKGTKYDEGGYADEKLQISELEDWETIEAVVNNSIINYNKAKEEINA